MAPTMFESCVPELCESLRRAFGAMSNEDMEDTVRKMYDLHRALAPRGYGPVSLGALPELFEPLLPNFEKAERYLNEDCVEVWALNQLAAFRAHLAVAYEKRMMEAEGR